ncbi:MAG: hypothetical protein HUK20_08345 [Fibrobacter sp.]|nr:hypothetical protein [Fibrobacter sp.]
MKKILIYSSIALSTLMLAACGQGTPEFTGYWQGEANMVFEVLSNDGAAYTIRNVNGDLSATIQNGKLCGKNSLDMEYCMSVKNDSAYYEFGGITTGYKRISKSEYETIFATQKRVNQ